MSTLGSFDASDDWPPPPELRGLYPAKQPWHSSVLRVGGGAGAAEGDGDGDGDGAAEGAAAGAAAEATEAAADDDECEHRLSYRVYGALEAHGAPALFLHGGPGAGCFPNHARFFDPDHYSVVLLDQVGGV